MSRPIIYPRRRAYVDRYSLTLRQAKHLTTAMLDQLDACKDESFRRVLLGVGRRAA